MASWGKPDAGSTTVSPAVCSCRVGQRWVGKGRRAVGGGSSGSWVGSATGAGGDWRKRAGRRLPWPGTMCSWLWLANHGTDAAGFHDLPVVTGAGARHQSGHESNEGEASARTCTASVAKDEGPQHDPGRQATQSEVENGKRGGAGVSRGRWRLDNVRSPWD